MDPAAAAAVPVARGEGGERAGSGAGGAAAAPGPPRSAPPRSGARYCSRRARAAPPAAAAASRGPGTAGAPRRSPLSSPAPRPGRPGEGKAVTAAHRFPVPGGVPVTSSVPGVPSPKAGRCSGVSFHCAPFREGCSQRADPPSAGPQQEPQVGPPFRAPKYALFLEGLRLPTRCPSLERTARLILCTWHWPPAPQGTDTPILPPAWAFHTCQALEFPLLEGSSIHDLPPGHPARAGTLGGQWGARVGPGKGGCSEGTGLGVMGSPSPLPQPPGSRSLPAAHCRSLCKGSPVGENMIYRVVLQHVIPAPDRGKRLKVATTGPYAGRELGQGWQSQFPGKSPREIAFFFFFFSP